MFKICFQIGYTSVTISVYTRDNSKKAVIRGKRNEAHCSRIS